MTPTVPETLAHICNRCLEKKPEARCTAGELAEALESWLREDALIASSHYQIGSPEQAKNAFFRTVEEIHQQEKDYKQARIIGCGWWFVAVRV